MTSDSTLSNPSDAAWKANTVRADLWIRERLGEWITGKEWHWEPAGAASSQYRLSMTYGSSTADRIFNQTEILHEDIFKHLVYQIWGRLIDSEWDKSSNRLKELIEREPVDQLVS